MEVRVISGASVLSGDRWGECPEKRVSAEPS